MFSFIRRHLSPTVAYELRRFRYAYLIKTHTFKSPEREYAIVPRMITPGSTVIDIGANVGHYTLLFSTLVGANGRVIAFEPIRETFAHLANNIVTAKRYNTTIINTAVLDSVQQVFFSIPNNNYYKANIDKHGDISCLAVPLDTFILDKDTVSFVKIDAEGADKIILESILRLIDNHRPIVMSEMSHDDMLQFSEKLTHYTIRSLPNSHNSFLIPSERCDDINELF